jgi:sugar lactone lactonase YvrE
MERVSDIQCKVGESPVWDAHSAAWYWVDIVGKRVWRLDGEGGGRGALRCWTTSEMVACIAPKESGGLIAGMETGLFSLDLGEGGQAGETRLARPASLGEGMRFNDGRTDRQGRFWSGTMFMDMSAARAIGELYRYSAEQGLSAPVVSELVTQNGLAWSPDGRTMYLSDSHPSSRLIWAFDYDTATGVPSNRRVFADLNQHVGRPDGAAVDAEGGYWTCANDAGCLLRFTPDGKFDRRVDVPFAKPSMCAFGGADMETLLVTSIPSGKPEDAEWGGAVVLLRTGIKGVVETRFKG